MRVAIIGAGPAGLFTGSALAGRGHEVVAVDRDTGPPADGRWPRRGVMQFHHAHGFRPQVGWSLEKAWPAALDAWLSFGAEPITFDLPGAGRVPGGHRSRRETFERALRTTAETVPGLTIARGHVDGVLSSGGRVRGIVVDGSPWTPISWWTRPGGPAAASTGCGRRRSSAGRAGWPTWTGSTACGTGRSRGR